MTKTFGDARTNKRFLLAALLFGLTACETSGPLGVYDGRVQFVLSSAPEFAASMSVVGPAMTGDHDDDYRERPFFVSANVTFTSILARNTGGVLVNVAMDLPAMLDVMVVEGGRDVTLPNGELPPATYDQIVVVMTAVSGVTGDGTRITIEPPGGGWTSVIPICPFVVEDGATTVVGLQLSVRRSFSWRDNRFRFEPHFECEDGGEDEEG